MRSNRPSEKSFLDHEVDEERRFPDGREDRGQVIGFFRWPASFRIIRALFLGTALLTGTGCPGLNQANLDDAGDSDGDGGGTATTLPPMTTAGTTTAGMTMTGGGSGDGTTGTDGGTTGGTTEGVTATEGTSTDGPGPTTSGDTTTAGDDTAGDTESESTTTSTSDGPGESTSTGDPSTSSSDTGCVPMGSGDYADCVMGDNCNSGTSSCLDLGGNDGVCIFDCVDVCDCPPGPPGANVVCGDADGGGGDECFISCEGGEACPGTLECFANTVCAHSNSPYGVYEGCNDVSDCPDGALCGVSGTMSTCFPTECVEDDDCPDGPPGSTVSCDFAFMGGGVECYIDCAGPLDCPEGWTCVLDYICMQPDP